MDTVLYSTKVKPAPSEPQHLSPLGSNADVQGILWTV